MLLEAAKIFSENYGVWGKTPDGFDPFPKPGKFDGLFPNASN